MSENTAGTGTSAKKLKRLWRKSRTGFSLKVFAQSLVKEGHDLAEDTKNWVQSKLGKLKTKCSPARDAHKKAMSTVSKTTKKK